MREHDASMALHLTNGNSMLDVLKMLKEMKSAHTSALETTDPRGS